MRNKDIGVRVIRYGRCMQQASRVREVNVRVHEVNMKQVRQGCEVSKYQRVLAA